MEWSVQQKYKKNILCDFFIILIILLGMPTINPQTYKQRADIWFTYCYMSYSQYISFSLLPKHCTYYFNFHIKEYLINRLSLNCLWFDLIPTFFVFESDTLQYFIFILGYILFYFWIDTSTTKTSIDMQ